MDGIVARPSQGFVKSFFFFCELLMELRGKLGVHDRTVSQCLRTMAVLQDASSLCSVAFAELRDAEEAEAKAEAEVERAADELHALTWCARENTRTLLAHIDAKPLVSEDDKRQIRDAWQEMSELRAGNGKDLGWRDEPEAMDEALEPNALPVVAKPAKQSLLARAHRFLARHIVSIHNQDASDGEANPQ